MAKQRTSPPAGLTGDIGQEELTPVWHSPEHSQFLCVFLHYRHTSYVPKYSVWVERKCWILSLDLFCLKILSVQIYFYFGELSFRKYL